MNKNPAPFGYIYSWRSPKWNADDLYLAYHEGHGGYQRQTYLSKDWLIRTAKKVAAQASGYYTQLKNCENEFKSNEQFF